MATKQLVSNYGNKSKCGNKAVINYGKKATSRVTMEQSSNYGNKAVSNYGNEAISQELRTGEPTVEPIQHESAQALCSRDASG
ncbi:hypothetical protein ACOMHN_035621 [Nucella lapillus]